MPQSAMEILLRTKKTVFVIQELSYLWKINNPDTLKSKIYLLAKNKKLMVLRKGIYAFSADYDKFELAGKLKSPSYVSLETVLYKAGIIFQYSTAVTSMSNVTKTIRCQGVDYIYHKIKDEILFSKVCMEVLDAYYIAAPEKAFLDTIYLDGSYYFDNLDSINWEKCFSLVKIYKNKALERRLKGYYKNYVRQTKT